MTQQERQRIAAGLADGLSYAEIGRRLERPTSTISREVSRNGGPGRYRPQQAHLATVRRARRGTPVASREGGPPGGTTEDRIVALAVASGMPRTMARVHVDLLMCEDGRRTAAELVRRLEVSPASVSVAVNYLVRHGYARRERDPRRRRDVYVVDERPGTTRSRSVPGRPSRRPGPPPAPPPWRRRSSTSRSARGAAT
ncbi:helix-turn-helix domain-containing protein [Streptomyces zhihengii]